jgi:hypothetical protein
MLGKPHFSLSSLGTDSATYAHITQSKRKGLKGGVGFWDIEPFGDMLMSDINNMAKWIFQKLIMKDLISDGGVRSLCELRAIAKCDGLGLGASSKGMKAHNNSDDHLQPIDWAIVNQQVANQLVIS